MPQPEWPAGHPVKTTTERKARRASLPFWGGIQGLAGGQGFGPGAVSSQRLESHAWGLDAGGEHRPGRAKLGQDMAHPGRVRPE